MMYLGIDPGKGGGFALLGADGAVLGALKMPETDRDLCDMLTTWTSGPLADGPVRAVLERVRSSPQMGVVSAFTFGRGVGAIMMALTAFEIPFDEVTPQRWQKALGCLTGGDKNVSKARAQALFPTVTVTHYLADALLLAEYLRRRESGALTHGEESREKEARKETAVEESRREDPPQRPGAPARPATARSSAPRHGGRAVSRSR